MTSKNIKFIVLILAGLISQFASAIHYHGGGVLPYAINPKNKKVYFLFSQEARGHSRGTWSDFGGKASPKDRNHPTWIAARECSEESIGLFGSYRQIQSKLLNGGRGIYRFNKPYAMFLMRVPFDLNINAKFQKARSKAKYHCQREKSELIWIEASTLKNALLRNQSIISFPKGKNVMIRKCTFSMLRNNVLRMLGKIR